MANTFYKSASEVDLKNTPFPVEMKTIEIDKASESDDIKTNSLIFHTGKNNKMYLPHSIMNENVAVNYRTISNFYALQNDSKDFTEYNDYLRCVSKETVYRQFLQDKKNPTYQNIMKYYGDDNFDKHGLSRYKYQDFLYLKYFNQIPNNYMITLRRYTRPCEDHMFGLDMNADQIANLHNYPKDYFAIATAVTYMGEKTGNKLSDIMKFDYGAKWEEKTAQVTSLAASDGGLAAQMKERAGVSGSFLSGDAAIGVQNLLGSFKQSMVMSVMCAGKGVPVNQAMAAQHDYESNAFSQKYGDQFYGDINVVDSMKTRSRGLTFSNNFSLNFEYSLKSLKCVNPRIAMMDILCNFLILTGNYGNFWGGATIFYGNRNIAPQYGDPSLLRKGKFGDYLGSLWKDVKQGFNNISNGLPDKEDGNPLAKLLNIAGGLLKGGLTAMIGNIFGGNVGVAGQSQIPPALLSGAPSGYWHLTIGNPLDPIAMMGNMAVTKTTVQFNDVLGYDDFPTEIKFTVEMEHCRPRDNAGIEAMFNAGKGRFYAFTSSTLENQYKSIDALVWAEKGGNGGTQEAQNAGGKGPTTQHPGSGYLDNTRLKIIGAQLNG